MSGEMSNMSSMYVTPGLGSRLGGKCLQHFLEGWMVLLTTGQVVFFIQLFLLSMSKKTNKQTKKNRQCEEQIKLLLLVVRDSCAPECESCSPYWKCCDTKSNFSLLRTASAYFLRLGCCGRSAGKGDFWMC